MYRITVIAVGRIKESFYSGAVDEYLKRLGRYAKMNVTVLQDEKTPDEAPEAVNTAIKEKEGKRILAAIPEGAYVISLAIEGKKYTSEGFSKLIGDIGARGNGHIVFIIGGSLGLSFEVLKRSDMLLSFSDMTFPHQMMRVILLEQVYRAFRIMTGEPYHK